uniref:C2H2-type domain-containing protein n=1 Tax=viral metagenome TaxID=1070528 RepID=A0A6C0BLT4_9ZZZZ
MSFICQYCHREFTMKHHLKRHLEEKRCKVLKVTGPMADEVKSLRQEIEILKNNVSTMSSIEKRLEQQEKKPIVNQNVLNVICVSNADNYLDMLTEKTGNFEQAIDYIKGCALSDLSGDCKLIEKIYFEQPGNIFFYDTGKTRLAYYNEHREQIHEDRTSFGRKIANNLQNSYLKGINYLIGRNLTCHMSPRKFLEEYDLQTWNTHIFNLSDSTYQRKMVSQLKIPLKMP